MTSTQELQMAHDIAADYQDPNSEQLPWILTASNGTEHTITASAEAAEAISEAGLTIEPK